MSAVGKLVEDTQTPYCPSRFVGIHLEKLLVVQFLFVGKEVYLQQCKLDKRKEN